MKKYDPNGDDPTQWLRTYQQWKLRVAQANRDQKAALAAYNTASTTANQLTAWRDQLASVLADMTARLGPYASLNSSLAGLATQLTDLDGQLADHEGARDTATARLLAGPGTDTAVVMLPVRVHTAWLDTDTLAVRILPSELGIDRHEPRLSPLELALGQAYWATRAQPGDNQGEQAWADLTRRLTPQRAAWVVRATNPTAPAAAQARDELDTAVTVRLLPDRFAVVLLAQGEPVQVSGPSGPAFVTWGEQVPANLPVPLLHEPGAKAWTTDLQAAVQQGLAMRVTVPTGAPHIDELIAVGLRAGSGPADLADLLQGHLYGAGVELLAAGAATNNSAASRTASGTGHDSAAMHRVVTGDPQPLTTSSAGRAAAELLGLPRDALANVPGASEDWGTVDDAVAALVQAAANGTLTDRYTAGPAGQPPALHPSGVAPALRVGRQPFGILPAIDASRWQPADAKDQQFAAAMTDMAAAGLAALDIDPARPVAEPPAPRRATRDDDSAMPAILLENASSTAWTDAAGTWAGLDAVVGPAGGPGSPASYLAKLAQGSAAAAVLTAANESVLGALAVAASTSPETRTAFSALADVAGTDEGRATIAAALGEQLDALSHRVDAWVTEAAAHRRASLGAAPVVGAYGYVTDVVPRPTARPRSFGHVLSPSLGHAATAAVLRSAYLGQRRAAWAGRVAAATAAQDRTAAQAAEAGLAALSPLDPGTEATLPLAVDLSAKRIRRARSVLRAVRDGQPLAVVLGQQFERGLVDAGLQQYLAAFRKLTRFSAGTELETLEATRRAAGEAVAAAQTAADAADAVVADHTSVLAAAQAAFDAASSARQHAVDAWSLFQPQVDARQHELDAAAAARAELAALLAAPPATPSHTHTVTVP